MCTIIVRHRMDLRCNTVIAANRDEFYHRAAEPPQVLSDSPRIVGGRDIAQGGTWFAITPSGAFFGVTNQRTWSGRTDAARSRGELALRILAVNTFEAMKEAFDAVDAREFNSFNALFGDGRTIGVAYGRTELERVEVAELPGGVHVLCNDRMDSGEFPKTRDLQKRVRAVPRRSFKHVKPALHALLSDHEAPDISQVPEPPKDSVFDREVVRQLQAACIHTPAYGTVSSTIAATNPGKVLHYFHAEGAPCTASFDDYTSLLSAS